MAAGTRKTWMGPATAVCAWPMAGQLSRMSWPGEKWAEWKLPEASASAVSEVVALAGAVAGLAEAPEAAGGGGQTRLVGLGAAEWL